MFDVSRCGYCNLLGPQDKRSKTPGDSKEAVAARGRNLARGLGYPLLRQLESSLESLGVKAGTSILDVGCGEGFFLAGLVGRFDAVGWGVDLSIPALSAAARQHKQCRFLAANGDRILPFGNGSFDVVVSITSCKNPPEFRRVLSPHGHLLVVVPGPDDLIELRQHVLGEGTTKDRSETTISRFRTDFVLHSRAEVRTVEHLGLEALQDVLAGTYRGARFRQRGRVAELREMDVTFSYEVLVFSALP